MNVTFFPNLNKNYKIQRFLFKKYNLQKIKNYDINALFKHKKLNKNYVF